MELFLCGVCTFCAILIVFLVRSHLKRQTQSIFSQIQNYFGDLLMNAKIEVKSHRKQGKSVEKLEQFSRKVKSWYEECLTQSDSEDDSVISVNKVDSDKDGARTKTCICQSNSTSSQKNESNETRCDEKTQNLCPNKFPINLDSQPMLNSIKIDYKMLSLIQDQICKDLLNELRFFTQRDLKSPLMICTDSSLSHISGYCLNFQTRICKFYIYPITYLPWKVITSQRDCLRRKIECRIKSLIFAMILWKFEINDIKKWSIYTGCWIVNEKDNEFARVAIDLMEHFTCCENIVRVNSNAHISIRRDAKEYARLIQPAWDLSRWNLFKFRKFIMKAYGFIDFQGSHLFEDNYRDAGKEDGYFSRSYRYMEYPARVARSVSIWSEKCKYCSLNLSQNPGFATR